jgi:hypothetical protein
MQPVSSDRIWLAAIQATGTTPLDEATLCWDEICENML